MHEINVILKKTRNVYFHNFYPRIQKGFVFMSDECQECLVINLYFGFVFLLIKLVSGEVMVKW